MRKCRVKKYSSNETTIQSAMIDMVKSFPDKETRPESIIFDGTKVTTGLWVSVPTHFNIKLEFMSEADQNQGVDMKPDKGYLKLSDGAKVKLLRTWHDPKFEKVVEYKGVSKSGRIFITNVYKIEQFGEIREEKWTGNAGMAIDKLSSEELIFNCSPGYKNPPDFSSLIFRITAGKAS